MPDVTAQGRAKTTLAWLLAPATEEVPHAQAIGAAGLRILVGLLWLYNVSWKRAPDFGQDAGNGLFKFTSYAVSHPVFAPYSWVVEHVVLAAFTPFGWLVLISETALAVLLLTGAWVRLAAVLGVAQSVAIALSVAFAPHEWPWSYWLMIGAHVVILFSSAGRVLAVDGVRERLPIARTVASFWGGLTMLVAAYSILRSLSDPLAARGPGLVSSELSVGLGAYNLLGGLLLAVIGALVVPTARGRSRTACLAAAALAATAGLSLHAQLGFTDPILGGTPTSAAYFFALAVVALAVGPARTGSTSTPRRPAHR